MSAKLQSGTRATAAGYNAACVDIIPSNRKAQQWQHYWNIYHCFHFTCSICPVSIWRRDGGGDTKAARGRDTEEKEGGGHNCSYKTVNIIPINSAYMNTYLQSTAHVLKYFMMALDSVPLFFHMETQAENAAVFPTSAPACHVQCASSPRLSRNVANLEGLKRVCWQFSSFWLKLNQHTIIPCKLECLLKPTVLTSDETKSPHLLCQDKTLQHNGNYNKV